MNLLGKVSVIGDDGPAFQGIHKLGRVKAKHFRVSETADHAAVMRRTEGVRGVE